MQQDHAAIRERLYPNHSLETDRAIKYLDWNEGVMSRM